MSMSASGGKADIPDTSHQCPLMTQSGRRAAHRLRIPVNLKVLASAGALLVLSLGVANYLCLKSVPYFDSKFVRLGGSNDSSKSFR